jgi:RNA polymerase sigma-70 factor (ECF subfamily)
MTHPLERIRQDFAKQLRAFIRRRVSNDAEAEDILQDVFLKLARRGDDLPAPAKLPGWIFLITRNAIIDRHRTGKTTVPVPESLADEDAGARELDGLCGALRRMIRARP